jgi:signal transduction histidine kinase
MEKIDIVELIKSVLILIEKTVLKDVEVQKEYSEGPFYIMANQERLSLSLFNLLINAKDAIKDARLKQGKISIKVDWIYENKTERFIKIQIGDNGIGIEEKNIDKIFLPYFTTKGKGGTGVGLSTVKQIIESSNGRVEVKSRLNKGTVFSIYFPEIK